VIAPHSSEHVARFLAVLRLRPVGQARPVVPVVVPVLVAVQVVQVVQAHLPVEWVRPVAGKDKDKAVRRVAPVLVAIKALPVLTARRVPVDVMGPRLQAQVEAPVQECPQPIRIMLRAALPG